MIFTRSEKMDLKNTGNFIKQKRKHVGLTQFELAEKLNISEKTVSKWECGNGFPDTTLIIPLCEQLNVSANELLSGSEIKGTEEYIAKAEGHLNELMANNERSAKFIFALEWVLGILSTIFLLSIVLAVSYFSMPTYLKVVLILLAVVCFIVGITFCLIIEKDVGYYECPHCHYKHIPSFKAVLFAMHLGRTRYFKCPKCGKRGWNKKVVK